MELSEWVLLQPRAERQGRLSSCGEVIRFVPLSGRESSIVRILAREFLLERFQWVGGHADMWPVFRDGDGFKAIIEALVAPFRGVGVTAVCGIESRGFLLGGASTLELGVGFVAVRKQPECSPERSWSGKRSRTIGEPATRCGSSGRR
jgi:hypothetical protein